MNFAPASVTVSGAFRKTNPNKKDFFRRICVREWNCRNSAVGFAGGKIPLSPNGGKVLESLSLQFRRILGISDSRGKAPRDVPRSPAPVPAWLYPLSSSRDCCSKPQGHQCIKWNVFHRKVFCEAQEPFITTLPRRSACPVLRQHR